MQDIRTNLAAEVNLRTFAALFGEFCLALFAIPFMEPRTQQLHRNLAVFVLRTFILALHDNPGRFVRNPHGRIGDVDVLSARAARPVAIDAKLFGLDVHFHRVINFRRNVNRGERSMPTVVKIKRRQPHEPVDSRLCLQVAVGGRAFNENSCAFNTRLIVRRYIHNFGLVAASVAPSEIHPHQHFSPILCVNATCARMDAENGVILVKLTVEH